MRFGTIATRAGEGAILAHSVRVGRDVLKKGRRLTAADISALSAAGITEIMAAELEPGDVGEDEAARRIAAALAGPGIRCSEPFTGRVNLYATEPGVALIDRARIIALNGLDEAVTVATVAPYERCAAGQMVATVKIITFAVAAGPLARAAAASHPAAVAVAPFSARTAGLILTELPAIRPGVLKKRSAVMRARLEALGSRLGSVVTVPHRIDAVAEAIGALRAAGADPILLFGASAIVDRGDVLPGALVAAGGEVLHLGMPVDPGNLLMLGRLGGADVIGVPSCAASPKVNGFDWVLERRLAGLAVSAADFAEMGPGGLLKEIETRPQPRAGGAGEGAADLHPRHRPRIAAIVLAAGRSSRMGGANKLLLEVEGEPMVRRAVRAALASAADPVIVVTGHQHEAVAAALADLEVTIIVNARHAEGLSTSLIAGLHALPPESEGALVLLADMPDVTAADIDRLIAAFAPKEGRSICVPTVGGRRGNPVLWGAAHFAELGRLTGDAGARALIDRHAETVAEVEMPGPGVLLDLDTPAALAARAARRRSPGD